jgi:hypothetical protein
MCLLKFENVLDAGHPRDSDKSSLKFMLLKYLIQGFSRR